MTPEYAAGLVEAWRADHDVLVLKLVHGPMHVPVLPGTEGAEPACRCYRCGELQIAATVQRDWTVDQSEVGLGAFRPICRTCVSDLRGDEGPGRKPEEEPF